MHRSVWRSLVDLVPHGYGLADVDWQCRPRLLLVVLAVHMPGLAAFGLFLDRPLDTVVLAVAVPAACLLVGRLRPRQWRLVSVAVTGGLADSSAPLARRESMGGGAWLVPAVPPDTEPGPGGAQR